MMDYDDILYFSFPVNFEMSDDSKKKFITVSLTPIKGVYSMFVRADGVPHPEQGFWVTEDNFLVIRSKDPEFSNKKDYTVGVKLLSPTRKENTDKFQFSIYYSFDKNHTTLKPSLLSSGKFATSKLYFSIEVSNEMDSIMILKSQSSVPYDMFISINPGNPFPWYGLKDYNVPDIQSGINLNEHDLNELKKNHQGDHSLIYVSIVGKNGTDFGIIYNYNN